MPLRGGLHEDQKVIFSTVGKMFETLENYRYMELTLGDSSYRLNFDQGKKNEIQHHS